MLTRRHVAALDGLRFVAASTVMLSHATYQLFPPGNWDGMTFAVWNLTHLANFGMTLFFVLSGFVIHWNYRNSIRQIGGLRAFFIARWSRLYPLFFAVFLVGLALQIVLRQPMIPLVQASPYFLTFTTSWWFWQIKGGYIFDAVNNAVLGVMWSLATEALFYCVYPLVAGMAAKLGRRSALAGLVLIGMIGLLLALAFVNYGGEIQRIALQHLGVDPSSGSQFLFWLGFHSPLMRFPSFLIGICAAQFVLCGGKVRPLIADAIVVACLLAIFGLAQVRTLFAMVDTSAGVIFFAGLCVAVSAEHSYAGRLMSLPLIVLGGEASYSIYLLHDPIIWTITRGAIHLHLPKLTFWVFIGIVTALVISRLCYVWFERPAQKFFRKLGSIILDVPGSDQAGSHRAPAAPVFPGDRSKGILDANMLFEQVQDHA